MKCGLLQINVKVGDVEASCDALVAAARAAAARGADFCVSAGMALTGFPPRGLLSHDGFLAAVEQGEQRLAKALADGPPLIVGSVGRGADQRVYHVAVLVAEGRICARHLTTCCGFDACAPEDRPAVITVGGVRLLVCGGADTGSDFEAADAPTAIVQLAAQPFYVGSHSRRVAELTALAQRAGRPIVSVNQVGGNDGVVCDGRSLVIAPNGIVTARGARCADEVLVVDLPAAGGAGTAVSVSSEADTSPEAEIWDALVLGTRDYARKTGMERAVLGLSGGVDSALVAAVACAALGPERVTGVLMPSPWSSAHSVEDALESARLLGMATHTVPIDAAMEAFSGMLEPLFVGRGPDLTEENMQARIRGVLLMAYANKFGALLLSTGNKSEVAVGYCTLYGDTCGGLAVIADVFKTGVYRLCDWLNRTHGPHIPAHTLTKPPSAELRPGQVDEDSLPPYDQLDAVLDALWVRRLPQAEVCAEGFAPDVVSRVARLIAGSEFKRHQLAPAVCVSAHTLHAPTMPIVCQQGVLW